MQIELLDQPILIVKSASPQETISDSPQEALLQIESLLEEEIVDIRNKILSENKETDLFANYLSSFNLHLQTQDEVISVLLESEWRSQIGEEGVFSENQVNEAEEIIDLQVSQLMRVIKISYSEKELEERKKVFKWLYEQEQSLPIISGLCSKDYLLVSGKNIFEIINSLKIL